MGMNRQNIIKKASLFTDSSELNRIEISNIRIFEAPIFGFAAADDVLFKTMQDPSVIGKHYMVPQEWLPEAQTVISYFLPFSNEVKTTNQLDDMWPSEEWLYGRIEGQAFLNQLCQYLISELVNAGYKCVVPSLDKRFVAYPSGPKASPSADKVNGPGRHFTSNWSERHAAFVCGLGTFGLSKGLITPKGMAGRFGSIITDLNLTPDERLYSDIYGYCSMCGACINRCPVNAISMDDGKSHQLCSDFLDKTKAKYQPRYGCGKCQVGVPCESKIP